MSITIEQLGFTKEELQNRVIDQLCAQVMHGVTWDDDGNEIETNSDFSRRLNKKIEERIDATISKMADQHVLPNVSSYIENLTLQETTKWGEKRGGPLTFIEYLAQRADAYMREEVNYDGKTQKDDSYSWKKAGTRIAWMVDKHLQYSIETAMKKSLQDANQSIAGGLVDAIKIKLAEVLAGLNVKVATK